MELIEGRAEIDDVDAFVGALQGIERETGAAVQAFDARYVLDRDHLERAVELAGRASERGEAIAREESVEILLYAAGRRQINRALEMGVSAGECRVVAVAVGGEESDAAARLRELLEPAETLSSYESERVRDFFEITERELSAADGDLSGLVRERMALLVVER